MMDPIEQFRLVKLVPIKIGSLDISFTNSSLFMVLAVTVITLFLVGATLRQSLIPTRLQSTAETFYEFVADMIQSTTGSGGMVYFPFVFSIFMFILFANIVGLIPVLGFTVTSHIIITVAFALLVFLTVIVVGLWNNGLHFFNIFVPKGVPVGVLLFVVPIEVFSFFVRPVSHSIRLFANMLAGHITLQVFAAFVVMLGAAGFVGVIGSVLPLAMTVALYALELLVAVLQAYVFAILTCIYLNDTLHPGH
jgi:F-type H+-transporting ATPase subunit a